MLKSLIVFYNYYMALWTMIRWNIVPLYSPSHAENYGRFVKKI